MDEGLIIHSFFTFIDSSGIFEQKKWRHQAPFLIAMLLIYLEFYAHPNSVDVIFATAFRDRRTSVNHHAFAFIDITHLQPVAYSEAQCSLIFVVTNASVERSFTGHGWLQTCSQ
jgi:hypothetical protein